VYIKKLDNNRVIKDRLDKYLLMHVDSLLYTKCPPKLFAMPPS
jgi:hypothetical protein